MSEAFLGQIIWVGFDFAPRNWAKCDGQILPINQNQSLYSILGTTYGGDGRTSFALPDLRGRTMVQQGTGAGISTVNLGQKFGVETVTISVNQMPAHNHTATLHAEDIAGPNNRPEGNKLGQTDVDTIYAAVADKEDVEMASDSVVFSQSGAGDALANRDPYQGINAIICLNGLFPPRN